MFGIDPDDIAIEGESTCYIDLQEQMLNQMKAQCRDEFDRKRVIFDELKFKHRRRVSHLRGPEYKRKEKKQFESYEEFGFIESVIAKSKQRLDDFIEKYDTNNSSQNS